MAEIIPLKEKRVRREQQIDLKQRKQEAAEKFIRQAHPGAACEKCGALLEEPETRQRVAYVFCQSCAREYVEYIEDLKGRGDPGITGITRPGWRCGAAGSTIKACWIDT